MEPIRLQWPPRLSITEDDVIELDLPLDGRTDSKWREYFSEAFRATGGMKGRDVRFDQSKTVTVSGLDGIGTAAVMSAVLGALGTANDRRMSERAPIEEDAQAVMEVLKANWKRE